MRRPRPVFSTVPWLCAALLLWGCPEVSCDGLDEPDAGGAGDDAGQPTDDGGQPTDDGGQPTDDGGQPTDDGGQPTDDGGQPDAGDVPDGGPQNLAPTFDPPVDLTVDENDPARVIAITGVSAGSAAEDATQAVSFAVQVVPTGLLSVSGVNGAGASRTLAVRPLADQVGTGTVSLIATDSAGASTSHGFVVTVRPVNQPPTIGPIAPVRVMSGAPQTVAVAGLTPGGGPDEASQPLSLSAAAADPALFAQLSTTQPSGGVALLTLVASAGAGVTQVTVTVSDGQAVNSTRAVSFAVMVNQAPPDVLAASVPAGALSGCVALSVTVSDSASLPADVSVEVDRGVGYRPGTLRGAQGLSTSPSGVAHSLVWRSPVDAPGLDATGVRLRVTASRGGVPGASRELTGLQLGNAASFLPQQQFGAGPGAFQAVLADVDLDGRLDVLTPDSFSNTLSLLRGEADGGFDAPVSFATTPAQCGAAPAKPFSLNVSDTNHDGWPDVLVVHENCDTVAELINAQDGGFQPFQTFSVGRNPLFGAVADLNCDGHVDVAVGNYLSNDVSLLFGDGMGGFRHEVRVGTGLNPNKIATADFDNDGVPDLVTADPTDDRVALLLGAGDGGFLPHLDVDAGPGPRNLAVGDFNGDGLVDVVTANAGNANAGTTCSVLLQAAPAQFLDPVLYDVELHPRSAAVGDVNGDGRLDFAIGNVDSNSVSVLVGLGDGTFVPARHYGVGWGPHSVALYDLDGDGRPELITGNTGSGNVSVLRNATPVCGP